MNEQDRARFRANIKWFNLFFEGIRTIYALVLEQLPAEHFSVPVAITSENYYFPRLKAAPSIPPYYALLVEGYKCGLQVITVVDASLIARNGYYFHEPSIFSVVHNQPRVNSRLDEIAMNVISNTGIDLTRRVNNLIWGRIPAKYSTDFFAFQVAVDKFSDTDKPEEVVRQHITLPITENLAKGFPVPA